MTQSPETVNHYSDRYWNDLPEVVRYMCRNATGNEDLWWTGYLKQRYASPPRKRALMIACGNGWVERELFDLGVASHFDAFDPNPAYLEQADQLKEDRSIDYFQATFTDFKSEHQYDLVINVAALHHAQYLYKCTQRLASALAPDGLLISWDYVGPSRNQYSDSHLALMQKANQDLPERFRSTHSFRPPLRTIVTGDPTEAVHASEISRAIEHYFTIEEWRELGGGIAYQILWNNIAEFEKGDPEAREVLDRLIELDAEHTRSRRVPNLFAFAVARPRSTGTRLAAIYDRHAKEPTREALSSLLLKNHYPGELWRRLFVRNS